MLGELRTLILTQVQTLQGHTRRQATGDCVSGIKTELLRTLSCGSNSFSPCVYKNCLN
jgi:hypothetical protein